jgi:ribosomal protein L40E
MDALELFFKVLLALLVVGFVGYPLLRQDWEEEEVTVPEELQELYRRKESTYSALKELEFDYKTGKLSEADFTELDTKYRAEAIELLEAIDLAEKGEAPKPRKPRKPRAERAASAGNGAAAASSSSTPRQAGASAGRAAAAGRVGRGLVCAECDAENPANARFCGSCGSELELEPPVAKRARKAAGATEDICEDCGQPVGAEHRFCAGCGAEVNA